MSVFRPAVKVTGPDGREWEIYAYKIKLGEALELEPDDPAVYDDRVWIVGGVVWLLSLIPRALARAAQWALAAGRAVRSDEWTIDAICWHPQETVYTWTTTGEFKGQVLAQVEGSLARGDVPIHLTNGVYRGERRSAR